MVVCSRFMFVCQEMAYCSLLYWWWFYVRHVLCFLVFRECWCRPCLFCLFEGLCCTSLCFWLCPSTHYLFTLNIHAVVDHHQVRIRCLPRLGDCCAVLRLSLRLKVRVNSVLLFTPAYCSNRRHRCSRSFVCLCCVCCCLLVLCCGCCDCCDCCCCCCCCFVGVCMPSVWFVCNSDLPLGHRRSSRRPAAPEFRFRFFHGNRSFDWLVLRRRFGSRPAVCRQLQCNKHWQL